MTEMDLFFEYSLSGMCGLFIVNVTTVMCPFASLSLFLIPFYCFCSSLSLSFALLNLSSSTHPDTFLPFANADSMFFLNTCTYVVGTIKFANSSPVCLPWQHWTKALVWFDDISAFHSCVVVDLRQSHSEWHV